jgi:chemosensory pili system protein ChpA (sensor histidine kinase/response regulator)
MNAQVSPPAAEAAPAAHPATAKPVEAAASSDRQGTVLVVDDSLTVRKITSRTLSREGYNVIVAKDGIEALEKMQSRAPDVIVTDIEMPRMDGFDLTRNVRADSRLKDLPVIMITSRTADKHRQHAAELGVTVFLGKPYEERELLDNIAGVMRAA